MVKKTISWKAWDNWLLILTFISLLSLGLVSLLGTVFSWWKNLTQPGWEKTWFYSYYLNSMNSYALPLALVLALLTVLCLPKRLISQKNLAYWLLTTAFCSLATSVFYGWIGFLFVFFGSSLLASTLTIYFFLVRPGQLKFQKEGRIFRLGSLLLHTGYLVFLVNITIFYNSSTPLKLFWAAFALIVSGNLLTVIAEGFKLEKKTKLSKQKAG